MKFRLICSVLLVSLVVQNVCCASDDESKPVPTSKPKQWLNWLSNVINKDKNKASTPSLDIKPASNATASDIPTAFTGQIWAVLVAGSNGYDNYRHQADVCHAYQVLRANGVPEDRIIVMMYDDIANNTENPVQGQIINEPDGDNVYIGVPKDYTGDDVNPDTFLKILTGDEKLKQSGRKTLDSGPNDHVLVYFCDHGGPGVIAFPDDVLGARKLNNVLIKMQKKQRFAQLLFYVEACESGSMFNKLLPTNLSILAVTASNPNEPSSACFFDDFRGTFLSDVFSHAWIEDTLSLSSQRSETVQKQFLRVRSNTNSSHVCSFGDKRVYRLPCTQFESGDDPKPSARNGSPSLSRTKIWLERIHSAIPVPHVTMFLAKWRMQNHSGAKQEQAKQNYQRLMMGRYLVDRTMFKLATRFSKTLNTTTESLLNDKKEISSFDCYEMLLDEFEQNCFRPAPNAYVLRKLGLLVNACERWTEDGANESTYKQMIVDVQSQCKKPSAFNRLRGIH